jgi:hypothetical protein
VVETLPDRSDGRAGGAIPPVAFYCVSSEMFFLGAVALINSLRLLGHREPVFVLDCGLAPRQREFLSGAATVVPAPGPRTPFLLKTVAPLRHPAQTMVLIDADIIVTRPLDEPIARASKGRVLAVEHGRERFFPEWGEVTGTAARPHPYVSSSLVFLGGSAGMDTLRSMDEVQRRIEVARTAYAGPVPEFTFLEGDTFDALDASYPFYFADQDVLNAVLATEVDPGRLEVLDRRAEAITPFAGLRIVDARTLRCAYEDGAEPFAVHQFLPTKPWVEPTAPGVYSRLLERLLRGGDVVLRVPKSELPAHLRNRLVGRMAGLAASLRDRRRAGVPSTGPGTGGG